MKSGLVIFSALAALCLSACSDSSMSTATVASNKVAVENADLGLVTNFSAELDASNNRNDLTYAVMNRWSTMTKDELNQVESITDFAEPRADGRTRDAWRNVWIAVLHNDDDVRDVETSVMGQSEKLTSAQLDLLRSAAYSTNFRITAMHTLSHPITGTQFSDSLVRYLTVVPEIQAEYYGGFDAFVDYVKSSTREQAKTIIMDKVQPGKVFFTVSEIGSIENIKLVNTSGYTNMDDAMVKAIQGSPASWTPAMTSSGTKVAQEFVFFFGSMGC